MVYLKHQEDSIYDVAVWLSAPLFFIFLMVFSLELKCFEPVALRPTGQCSKSSDWCHAALPSVYSASMLWQYWQQSIAQFTWVSSGGTSCKLFTPFWHFLLWHTTCTCINISTTICTTICKGSITLILLCSSMDTGHSHYPLLPELAKKQCISCVASPHPKTSGFFFLSWEILSHSTLCFNSEKQVPSHLSVFPYLQPHRVLQDLSTTQVTQGGVGSEQGLQYQWRSLHATTSESSHHRK